MWIDAYLSNIFMTLGPKLYNQYCNSSQQCSKKENFFDAPNSNFPLLNWLDIIVHRIESICTDRPMSRLHIFVHENRHVQLLYRPSTFQFSRNSFRNKLFSVLFIVSQKILDNIFFQLFGGLHVPWILNLDDELHDSTHLDANMIWVRPLLY